jgi:hypothetical protein
VSFEGIVRASRAGIEQVPAIRSSHDIVAVDEVIGRSKDFLHRDGLIENGLALMGGSHFDI